jgi:hypothetical protein
MGCIDRAPIQHEMRIRARFESNTAECQSKSLSTNMVTRNHFKQNLTPAWTRRSRRNASLKEVCFGGPEAVLAPPLFPGAASKIASLP